jgi:hypothetical protein
MNTYYTRLKIKNTDSLGKLFKLRLAKGKISYLVTIDGPTFLDKKTLEGKFNSDGFSYPSGLEIPSEEKNIYDAMHPKKGKPIFAHWQIFDAELPSKIIYNNDLKINIDEGKRIWFGNAANFLTTTSDSNWNEATIKPYMANCTPHLNEGVVTPVTINISCKCPCRGTEKIIINDIKSIKSYTGDFPSPFQIINYTASTKNEPLLHQVHVPDSTIRGWIKNAAEYHGIPHAIIAVIIQQENAPKASKWKQFLQFGERTLTTTAAIIDKKFWDIFPDKVADGSAGFMNMRRPTLIETIKYNNMNYCKDIIPKEVANRIGYFYDSNIDESIQGYDWRADLYYGAAHIRQLIDRQLGKCASGNINLEQVEKVFASYNGSGPTANKYGKDAITLLKNASEDTAIIYFYEK